MFVFMCGGVVSVCVCERVCFIFMPCVAFKNVVVQHMRDHVYGKRCEAMLAGSSTRATTLFLFFCCCCWCIISSFRHSRTKLDYFGWLGSKWYAFFIISMTLANFFVDTQNSITYDLSKFWSFNKSKSFGFPGILKMISQDPYSNLFASFVNAMIFQSDSYQ